MSIYYDYGYGSDFGAISSGIGFIQGLFGFFIVMILLTMAVSIVMCIAQWKIFTKAGKQGWISLIPIYNMWVFLEITGLHGWLALIPFANVVSMVIADYKLAIMFGKSTGFAVCTIFFPMVCLPIIAFDKSTYNGGSNVTDGGNVNASMNMQNNNVNVMVNQQPIINNQPVYSQEVVTPSYNVQPNVDAGVNSNVNENLQNDTKVCPNCQNVNTMSSAFCTRCGTKL